MTEMTEPASRMRNEVFPSSHLDLIRDSILAPLQSSIKTDVFGYKMRHEFLLGSTSG